MKRWYTAALMLVIALLFAGCAKAQIENAIQDFEDAVNEDDTDALVGILADASLFKVGDPTFNINALLDHFDGFRPVTYSNLDIDVNGTEADVNADASLSGISEDALFIMLKEGGDWKVREYWDTNNVGGNLEFIWHKIQRLIKKKLPD